MRKCVIGSDPSPSLIPVLPLSLVSSWSEDYGSNAIISSAESDRLHVSNSPRGQAVTRSSYRAGNLEASRPPPVCEELTHPGGTCRFGTNLLLPLLIEFGQSKNVLLVKRKQL